MQKWEYLVIGAEWDNKTQAWYATSANGKAIVHEEIYQFINQSGSAGWELVNVTCTTQTDSIGLFLKHIYTTWYRFFFKRPIA
jgi:hypothetical protein